MATEASEGIEAIGATGVTGVTEAIEVTVVTETETETTAQEEGVPSRMTPASTATNLDTGTYNVSRLPLTGDGKDKIYEKIYDLMKY